MAAFASRRTCSFSPSHVSVPRRGLVRNAGSGALGTELWERGPGTGFSPHPQPLGRFSWKPAEALSPPGLDVAPAGTAALALLAPAGQGYGRGVLTQATRTRLRAEPGAVRFALPAPRGRPSWSEESGSQAPVCPCRGRRRGHRGGHCSLQPPSSSGSPGAISMAVCLGGVPFYLSVLRLFERAASRAVGTPMRPRGAGVEACGVGAAPGRPCWRGEGSRATARSRLEP